MAGRPRKGRYANIKKTVKHGITFDSKAEADRYTELLVLEQAGVIQSLERQPRIPIIIGGVAVRYHPSNRQMVYQADFRYLDLEKGIQVIEDVKMQSGYRTEIYKFKRALIHTMGLVITEV